MHELTNDLHSVTFLYPSWYGMVRQFTEGFQVTGGGRGSVGENGRRSDYDYGDDYG